MTNIEYKLDYPIKDLTTYKTQGTLPVVVFPKNINECKILVEKLEKLNLGYFIIGRGSNLLISPDTTKICINLSKMREKIKISDNFVKVSAQTALSKVFLACKTAGLSGLEKISTIPASVGGIIKNNASFMGVDAFSCLEKITLLNEGKVKSLQKSQCAYSYRHTQLPAGIILSATFQLKPSSIEEITSKYYEALSYRNQIQPKGFSCGCVFRNPQNFSAGYLIEQCGLKGKRKGGAIISEKHANFIINDDNATFDEVNYLIEFAKEEVYHKFGIVLEEEVEKIQ